MATSPRPTQAVLAAVRSSQELMRAHLGKLQESAKLAHDAYLIANAKVETARKELYELAEFLEAHEVKDSTAQNSIEQITKGLAKGIKLWEEMTANIEPPQLRELVVREALSQLKDRRFVRTETILEELIKKRINLGVANPANRISQILTNDPLFVNKRSLGWSLAIHKGESPGATGPSSATESDGS